MSVARRMWLGLVLASVAVCVLVVGASARTADPKAMVLRPSDMPAGYSLKEGGYTSNAEAAKHDVYSSLSDFVRWGRITGYKASYQRESILGGPFTVDSEASTYKTVRGARDSIRASFANASKPNSLGAKFRRVSVGGALGHEARAYATDVDQDGVSATVVVVLWRYATVKASIAAAGLKGTVDAATVVRLARRQQARIKTALR